MKKINKIQLIAIIIALLLTGCGTAQVHEFNKEKEFNKSYGKVWERIVEWFGSTGNAIKLLEKDAGIITSEGYTRDDECYDCGMWHDRPVLLQYNLVVKKISDTQTKVTVNVFPIATSTGAYGVKSNVNCYSRGKVEKDLLDFIER